MTKFENGNQVLYDWFNRLDKKYLNRKEFTQKEEKFMLYLAKLKQMDAKKQKLTDREKEILEHYLAHEQITNQMGIFKIRRGTCPTGENSCWFCTFGHLTECHHYPPGR